ncbi:MAG: hypothetical protein KGH85_05240 [Thaumarchaeota archaeon]|nr:hypothetical protein [Nitrososphaerota archaeon]
MQTDSNIKQPHRPGIVHVVLPVKVANNIDLLHKAISNSVAEIVKRSGCAACCSGIDIHFQNEINFVINPETLKLTPMSEAGM